MRDITYPPIIVTASWASGCSASASSCTGAEHVPRKGGVLLAINHIGYVDFIYGGLAANPSGRLVRFMIKREMIDNRGTGPLMRSLHHIEVDRDAGVPSYRKAVDYLQAGEVVGIFPEATISRAFEIKEFKTGAVRIAADAGVPLVPVVLWGTQRLMTKDHPRDFSRGTSIAIRVGEPLHPTGEDPTAETAELHAADGGPARGGDRGLPRRRAAARLVVGPAALRRQRPDPRARPNASTARRSGPAPPRDGPSGTDKPTSLFVDKSTYRLGVPQIGRSVRLRGSITSTIRRRSSSEANSTVILPLDLPRSTLTRVSSRSESRSDDLARARARTARLRRARVAAPPVSPTATISSRPRTLMPSATTRCGQPVLELRVLDGQQRAGVAGGEHAGGDPSLDGGRELEQPQRVADLGPRATDPGGQLVVGAAEVLEQLAVGRRLLQRVELGAVQVLQQRVAQHVVVAGLPDDGRDRLQAGLLGGAPPTLAHDQLVSAVADAAGRRSAAAGRPRRSRCTSSAIASSSKTWRGWTRLGVIEASGSSAK